MPLTMPEHPSSLARSKEDTSLPPLLPGEYMWHDNRRLKYPPKSIGYERALKKAEEALRRDLYEEDFTPINTLTPVSTRRRSSTLRPDAPAFTPTKAINNNSRFRVQPVIPRLNPADRFRENNKDVVAEAFNVTPRTEKSKVSWEGSDDSSPVTPKGPPTWLEKMEVLTGSKLKPSQHERALVDIVDSRSSRAPRVAIPSSFTPSHLRK